MILDGPGGGLAGGGRGVEMASVRSEYLKEIRKNGRPAPRLDSDCFEADVDWPRLSSWIPLSSCPLKLGRTQIAINGGAERIFYDSAMSRIQRPFNGSLTP